MHSAANPRGAGPNSRVSLGDMQMWLTRQQASADARWIRAIFIFLASHLTLVAAFLEVCIDLRAPPQIVSNHGINVGQVKRRILMDNLR